MSPSALKVLTYNFINFPKGDQAPRVKTHERWICEPYSSWSLSCREDTCFRNGVGNLLKEVSSGDQITGHRWLSAEELKERIEQVGILSAENIAEQFDGIPAEEIFK